MLLHFGVLVFCVIIIDKKVYYLSEVTENLFSGFFFLLPYLPPHD